MTGINAGCGHAASLPTFRERRAGILRLLIVYATVHGQTRKVSEFLAGHLGKGVHKVELHQAENVPAGLDPADFDAVVLTSPLRMGAYRRSVVAFAARHRAALARVPSAFVTVSLSVLNTRDPERARAAHERYLAGFVNKTGWRPVVVHKAAGSLDYTRYTLPTRWIMLLIARIVGKSTDTSRDHEYTDWDDLARFADAFAASAVTAGN